MAITAGTPTQAGVGYIATAARTFSTGAIVPLADTYSETPEADGQFSENETGAWDVYGTKNHRIVVRADFKLKTGTTCPTQGAVLTDDTDSFKWVVSEAPEYKAFNNSSGQPMLVGLVLTYTAAISAAA